MRSNVGSTTRSSAHCRFTSRRPSRSCEPSPQARERHLHDCGRQTPRDANSRKLRDRSNRSSTLLHSALWPPLCIGVAQNKAYTALFGVPTQDLFDFIERDPPPLAGTLDCPPPAPHVPLCQMLMLSR